MGHQTSLDRLRPDRLRHHVLRTVAPVLPLRCFASTLMLVAAKLNVM